MARHAARLSWSCPCARSEAAGPREARPLAPFSRGAGHALPAGSARLERLDVIRQPVRVHDGPVVQIVLVEKHGRGGRGRCCTNPVGAREEEPRGPGRRAQRLGMREVRRQEGLSGRLPGRGAEESEAVPSSSDHRGRPAVGEHPRTSVLRSPSVLSAPRRAKSHQTASGFRLFAAVSPTRSRASFSSRAPASLRRRRGLPALGGRGHGPGASPE